MRFIANKMFQKVISRHWGFPSYHGFLCRVDNLKISLNKLFLRDYSDSTKSEKIYVILELVWEILRNGFR